MVVCIGFQQCACFGFVQTQIQSFLNFLDCCISAQNVCFEVFVLDAEASVIVESFDFADGIICLRVCFNQIELRIGKETSSCIDGLRSEANVLVGRAAADFI